MSSRRKPKPSSTPFTGRHLARPLRKDTFLSHAGRDSLRFDGAVNVPVIRASTVLFSDYEDYETSAKHKFDRIRYGIHGTTTQRALEEALAELEGGYRAMAVCSGLAAIAIPLLAFTRAGDHILVADTVYGPNRNFCDKVLGRYGVTTTYYDPAIGGGIGRLMRKNTRLVFCESPGSLTFEMQDIPAIASVARARSIPVLADTTWATPYFYRPFEQGIDVSIHAGTKYIVGHSDVMLGTITTNERYYLPVRQTMADTGYSLAPDDAYLALRGLRTIGVRLKRQMQSGLEVARWLQARPEVARVLHPALPEDPGHALWKRDFLGASSLFGVELRPCPKRAVRAMIDSLKLFGIGSSWGGYESLVTNPEPEGLRTATRWRSGPLLRLHIGLEDPADLIADLKRGFAVLARTAKRTPG